MYFCCSRVSHEMTKVKHLLLRVMNDCNFPRETSNFLVSNSQLLAVNIPISNICSCQLKNTSQLRSFPSTIKFNETI